MILKDLDRPRPVASHPLPLSLPGAGASVLPLEPLVRGHSAPASAHQATQTPGRQVRGIRYFESEGEIYFTASMFLFFCRAQRLRPTLRRIRRFGSGVSEKCTNTLFLKGVQSETTQPVCGTCAAFPIALNPRAPFKNEISL